MMYEQQLVMTKKQVMDALQCSLAKLDRMKVTGELCPLPRTDPNKREKTKYAKTDVEIYVEKKKHRNR